MEFEIFFLTNRFGFFLQSRLIHFKESFFRYLLRSILTIQALTHWPTKLILFYSDHNGTYVIARERELYSLNNLLRFLFF